MYEALERKAVLPGRRRDKKRVPSEKTHRGESICRLLPAFQRKKVIQMERPDNPYSTPATQNLSLHHIIPHDLLIKAYNALDDKQRRTVRDAAFSPELKQLGIDRVIREKEELERQLNDYPAIEIGCLYRDYLAEMLASLDAEKAEGLESGEKKPAIPKEKKDEMQEKVKIIWAEMVETWKKEAESLAVTQKPDIMKIPEVPVIDWDKLCLQENITSLKTEFAGLPRRILSARIRISKLQAEKAELQQKTVDHKEGEGDDRDQQNEKEEFVSWPKGNLFFGPDTTRRTEPGGKNDLDTDAGMIGKIADDKLSENETPYRSHIWKWLYRENMMKTSSMKSICDIELPASMENIEGSLKGAVSDEYEKSGELYPFIRITSEAIRHYTDKIDSVLPEYKRLKELQEEFGEDIDTEEKKVLADISEIGPMLIEYEAYIKNKNDLETVREQERKLSVQAQKNERSIGYLKGRKDKTDYVEKLCVDTEAMKRELVKLRLTIDDLMSRGSKYTSSHTPKDMEDMRKAQADMIIARKRMDGIQEYKKLLPKKAGLERQIKLLREYLTEAMQNFYMVMKTREIPEYIEGEWEYKLTPAEWKVLIKERKNAPSYSKAGFRLDSIAGLGIEKDGSSYKYSGTILSGKEENDVFWLEETVAANNKKYGKFIKDKGEADGVVYGTYLLKEYVKKLREKVTEGIPDA